MVRFIWNGEFKKSPTPGQFLFKRNLLFLISCLRWRGMIASPVSLTVVSTCNEVGMCNGLGHLNVTVRACSFVTKSFFRCPNKNLGACGHVIFRALGRLWRSDTIWVVVVVSGDSFWHHFYGFTVRLTAPLTSHTHRHAHTDTHSQTDMHTDLHTQICTHNHSVSAPALAAFFVQMSTLF